MSNTKDLPVKSNQLNSVAKRKKSFGQGMTEYIIIVGVIAVAAIGVFGYFGDVLKDQTAGMANELAGGDAATNKAAAQASAAAATTASADHNDLSNYDENAQSTGGTASP